MLPKDKVQHLIDRHLKLEKELSSGEIDKKKYAEISKEYADLNDIIKQAKEYLTILYYNPHPLLSPQVCFVVY